MHYLGGMKSINSLVWQHGLIAGGLTVVMTLTAFLIGPTAMVSTPMSVAQLGIVLVTMVVSGLAIRRDEGGFLIWKRAWLHLMLVVGILSVVGALFNIVMYEWIATPEFLDSMIRITKEKTVESMSAFGVPSSMVEEIETGIEAEMLKSLSPLGLIKGVFWSALIWAIPAMIVALVIRRNDHAEYA